MNNQPPTNQYEMLNLKRVFNALPERVFTAWTNPQQLKSWWKPPGSTVTTVEVDLRVGGQYRIGLKQPTQATYFVSGVYQVIQRPRRLVFTWRWENPEMDIGESLVSIEFRAKNNQTELELTHQRLPTLEARQAHKKGWEGIFDSLDRFVPNQGIDD